MEIKEYKGLYEQMITEPKYYCICHQVFLRDEDTIKHKCFCKKTFDMHSEHRCEWLVPIDEYDEYRKQTTETAHDWNAKQHGKKLERNYKPKSAYQKAVKKLLEEQNG